jgi:hypothetical protein
MLSLDTSQLSAIAARLPAGDVRDDLLRSDLALLRLLDLNSQMPSEWHDLWAQPELSMRLRALKWVIVDLDQTNALDAAPLQTIGFLKNSGWCRVIVLPKNSLLPSDCQWVEQLKALGFLLQGEAHRQWALVFDVGSYKATPDWLNARHWANPQLWDKYRW